MWHKKEGYPGPDFFQALHPKMKSITGTKISTDIVPIGSKVGEISEKRAKLSGLKEGTAVAAGNVDAHVALPAVGITKPAKLLMIVGTSTCHIVMSDQETKGSGDVRRGGGRCGAGLFWL